MDISLSIYMIRTVKVVNCTMSRSKTLRMNQISNRLTVFVFYESEGENFIAV